MTGNELAGRRVLVTGASQGLGREIARHCFAAGADVAFCARSASDLDSAAAAFKAEFSDRRIVARICDIARSEQVDQFFDAALAVFGDLDAVINNAGVHGPIGPIEDIDWGAWVQAISINLVGTAYVCRRAIGHFKSRAATGKHGKIVNISGGGATVPQPGLTAYGASKAGLVRLTEALAHETRPFGIDINTVAPGALATRLMKELNEAGPDKIGAGYHARIEEFVAKGGMPMSRAAELCVYLASAESDGLTGRLIAAAWDPWPFTDSIKADIDPSDIYTLRRIIPRERGFDWGDK
jgi:NAD(P)-dependent dehydrogenase (short-subunit alcohol dehydrogenase family)